MLDFLLACYGSFLAPFCCFVLNEKLALMSFQSRLTLFPPWNILDTLFPCNESEWIVIFIFIALYLYRFKSSFIVLNKKGAVLMLESSSVDLKNLWLQF